MGGEGTEGARTLLGPIRRGEVVGVERATEQEGVLEDEAEVFSRHQSWAPSSTVVRSDG